MRSIWNNLIKILREPAVETTLAILTFLITIVWGAIQGWLSRFVLWLLDYWLWPNWLVIFALLGFTVCSSWIGFSIRKSKVNESAKPKRKTYHQVWGVIWSWPPPGGRYTGEGPLCPLHKITVDVIKFTEYSEQRFEFHCPGEEGEKGHTIKGPKFSQLVGYAEKGIRDVSLYEDVNSRLRAKEITSISK